MTVTRRGDDDDDAGENLLDGFRPARDYCRRRRRRRGRKTARACRL